MYPPGHNIYSSYSLFSTDFCINTEVNALGKIEIHIHSMTWLNLHRSGEQHGLGD